MNLQTVLDFIFPPQCAACSKIGSGLCRACFPGVESCGVRLPTLRVDALGEYAGAIKTAVLALKNGRRDVARALAERLCVPAVSCGVLVPVPTTALRRLERGFDGCELMARRISALTGARVAAGLQQIRGDRQRGRTRTQRLAARGRFVWRGEALNGISVVLLDDVVTTGATLEDCAAVVRAAGGVVERAVAAAITPIGGSRQLDRPALPGTRL